MKCFDSINQAQKSLCGSYSENLYGYKDIYVDIKMFTGMWI